MEDLRRQFDHITKAGVATPTNYSDTPSNFRPLLLFIPLRLGQDKFNMEYAEALKTCLSLRQSVGIIGGKPRHALWFFGYHSERNGMLIIANYCIIR